MNFHINKIKLSAMVMIVALQFTTVNAQIGMPTPGTPKSVAIPAVKENKLPNGLTVAVVERRNIPLVSVQLLFKSGAGNEAAEYAGLTDFAFSLLSKGTQKRTATDIANQIEFLGGSIWTGASWNSSRVMVNVMSDKLEAALDIMSDVVQNPVFKQNEVDLLKTQTLDNLTYNMNQPGYVASYVGDVYSFNEHPANGTPNSVSKINRADIVDIYRKIATPDNAVLIFTGDISAEDAKKMATKYFGKWNAKSTPTEVTGNSERVVSTSNNLVRRMLVVDMPQSGQAAVKYLKSLKTGRVGNNLSSDAFYTADVLNSVLGGGYSSRLNQEIRIKRGLSYGAGSNFGWRYDKSNFSATTQTKNESAGEVAELIVTELQKLTDAPVAADELNPRKLVMTGDFSRDLETNSGLARAVANLYSYNLPASELNTYMSKINAVSDRELRDFAVANLKGGDIIIVGDYAIFKDDLAKRFPNIKIDVIQAKDLDLNKL